MSIVFCQHFMLHPQLTNRFGIRPKYLWSGSYLTNEQFFLVFQAAIYPINTLSVRVFVSAFFYMDKYFTFTSMVSRDGLFLAPFWDDFR